MYRGTCRVLVAQCVFAEHVALITAGRVAGKSRRGSVSVFSAAACFRIWTRVKIGKGRGSRIGSALSEVRPDMALR